MISDIIDLDNMNFSQKCGLACEFIPFINREDFRYEFITKKNEDELTSECREYLMLVLKNYDKFIMDLDEHKLPKELKKYKKENNQFDLLKALNLKD